MKIHPCRRATQLVSAFYLGLGLFTCAIATSRAADAYTFSKINLPGAVNVHGQGIDSQGNIAGNSDNGAGYLIGWVRLKNGATTFQDFGVPGTTETNGVNETGLAWGTYFGTDGVVHGFTVRNGVKADLDYPGVPVTVPVGISNGGSISGLIVDGNGAHGLFGTAGALTLFDHPAGVGATFLLGNNDHGQCVGFYFDAQGGHSFLKSGNTLTPINVPGSVYTQAGNLNNRGDIVGHYQTTPGLEPGTPEHGFLLRDGVYTTINYPGARATRLFEINDAGDLIGSGIDAQGHDFGFTATVGKNGPKN